ncbi:MAG: efflux RND transporter periplasmic adaptor subunit [Pseudomonadota bacterium]
MTTIDSPPASRRRPGFQIVVVLLLVSIAAAAWWWFKGRAGDKPPAPPAAVPVSVVKAEQRDLPHLTRAIGTAQSLHSVTLRSQVDGILTQVMFKEGEPVKKGQLLATIDDRSIAAMLDQARAERARNAASLKAAEVDLQRYGNLLKEEAIAKQQVDQQTATVDQLRATVRANDAAIAAAQVQLSHTRIVSPVTGRVGIRRVDTGNLIRTSDAEGLVTVTQIDPIAVMFSLPQELLPRIQESLRGQKTIAVEAASRDGGQPLATGKLLLVDNQIDSTTGTVRLKAEFQNADSKLWAGQFVTVQLRTGNSPNAIVVPSTAVQRGLKQPFVYRINNDKAEPANIEIGYQNEDVTVINTGLAAGDVVVSDGQSRLKPGSMVKVLNNDAPAAAVSPVARN